MKRVILLLMICLSAACTSPEPPLRVGLLDWPPYGFAKLAERLGYYGEGRIEIVEFQSPAEVVRAYRVGGLDIVAFTADFASALANDADKSLAFLIIDESHGADAAISRAPITDLHDLAGKRVGLESSELGAHMLGRMLDHASLTLDDIDVEFYDIPDQLLAWQNNEVDVMITYEPIRTKLLQAGGQQIFSSAELPGEVVDIFVAREATIQRRLNDFRLFAAGWFRALEYYQQDSQQALTILTEETQLSRTEFVMMLQGVRMIPLEENRRLLGGDNAAFIEALSRFIAAGSAGTAQNARATLPAMLSDIALPLRTD